MKKDITNHDSKVQEFLELASWPDKNDPINRQRISQQPKKFRGYTEDGFSCYGALVGDENAAYICEATSIDINDPDLGQTFIPIVPETTAQYIGTTDDEQREIYETDIVEYFAGEYYQGQWEFSGTEVVPDIRNLALCDFIHADKVIVIGDCHKNPELIPKKAESKTAPDPFDYPEMENQEDPIKKESQV